MRALSSLARTTSSNASLTCSGAKTFAQLDLGDVDACLVVVEEALKKEPRLFLHLFLLVRKDVVDGTAADHLPERGLGRVLDRDARGVHRPVEEQLQVLDVVLDGELHVDDIGGFTGVASLVGVAGDHQGLFEVRRVSSDTELEPPHLVHPHDVPRADRRGPPPVEAFVLGVCELPNIRMAACSPG